MLSRFVIVFLPKSKHLLISWLQSPCAVILELRKIKSVTVSVVSPSICHEMMGLDATIFVFFLSLVLSQLFPLSPSSVQFSSVTQSSLTLCDPIDGSPPGPAVPGILQARTLEWVYPSPTPRVHPNPCPLSW